MFYIVFLVCGCMQYTPYYLQKGVLPGSFIILLKLVPFRVIHDLKRHNAKCTLHSTMGTQSNRLLRYMRVILLCYLLLTCTRKYEHTRMSSTL